MVTFDTAILPVKARLGMLNAASLRICGETGQLQYRQAPSTRALLAVTPNFNTAGQAIIRHASATPTFCSCTEIPWLRFVYSKKGGSWLGP